MSNIAEFDGAWDAEGQPPVTEVAIPATADKGFGIQVRNHYDFEVTVVMQKDDDINRKVSWQVITLGPKEAHFLGYDRPDGPVYRQWYFWTSSLARRGSNPPYPAPIGEQRSDGDALGMLLLLKHKDTAFMVNRNTRRGCHAIWTSGNGLHQDEWMEPGSLRLGDMTSPTNPRPLSAQVEFSSLGNPVHGQRGVLADRDDGAVVPGPPKGYANVAMYSWPGPLPCGAVSEGASPPVDAGPELGFGCFLDYWVMCGGSTVFVQFNGFRPAARSVGGDQPPHRKVYRQR